MCVRMKTIFTDYAKLAISHGTLDKKIVNELDGFFPHSEL